MPNIKFPIIVEHWSINVHLHNKCSFAIILLILFLKPLPQALISLIRGFTLFIFCNALAYSPHNVIELVDLVDDCDSSALISIFTWLYDPNVSSFSFFQIALLLFDFLLFFYYCFSSIVICDESFVLRILQSFLYVECEGYIIK